jgi:hypothetical protein
LICASNNSTPFRFDEYGGLVTVMKNPNETTTINNSNNPSTNPTTDFLLQQ